MGFCGMNIWPRIGRSRSQTGRKSPRSGGSKASPPVAFLGRGEGMRVRGLSGMNIYEKRVGWPAAPQVQISGVGTSFQAVPRSTGRIWTIFPVLTSRSR